VFSVRYGLNFINLEEIGSLKRKFHKDMRVFSIHKDMSVFSFRKDMSVKYTVFI
jgi:hypothetical protein